MLIQSRSNTDRTKPQMKNRRKLTEITSGLQVQLDDGAFDQVAEPERSEAVAKCVDQLYV